MILVTGNLLILFTALTKLTDKIRMQGFRAQTDTRALENSTCQETLDDRTLGSCEHSPWKDSLQWWYDHSFPAFGTGQVFSGDTNHCFYDISLFGQQFTSFLLLHQVENRRTWNNLKSDCIPRGSLVKVLNVVWLFEYLILIFAVGVTDVTLCGTWFLTL